MILHVMERIVLNRKFMFKILACKDLEFVGFSTLFRVFQDSYGSQDGSHDSHDSHRFRFQV